MGVDENAGSGGSKQAPLLEVSRERRSVDAGVEPLELDRDQHVAKGFVLDDLPDHSGESAKRRSTTGQFDLETKSLIGLEGPIGFEAGTRDGDVQQVAVDDVILTVPHSDRRVHRTHRIATVTTTFPTAGGQPDAGKGLDDRDGVVIPIIDGSFEKVALEKGRHL